MRALAIAATGMNAQQMNVEVIANNIANINTTAFKARPRGIYRPALSGGAAPGRARCVAARRRSPKEPRSGSGVKAAAIRNLHMQGALTNTANKLDLAINGQGWFQVQGPEGEVLFSRAGAFNTNARVS